MVECTIEVILVKTQLSLLLPIQFLSLLPIYLDFLFSFCVSFGDLCTLTNFSTICAFSNFFDVKLFTIFPCNSFLLKKKRISFILGFILVREWEEAPRLPCWKLIIVMNSAEFWCRKVTVNRNLDVRLLLHIALPQKSLLAPGSFLLPSLYWYLVHLHFNMFCGCLWYIIIKKVTWGGLFSELFRIWEHLSIVLP